MKMLNRATFQKMASPPLVKFSLLLRFSQPANLLTLLLATYTGFLLFPRKLRAPWEPSTLSSLLYVGTFATHFGTQIWMTFISGLVLFFNLPRQTFGLVQRQLFPKYFFLNAILGFTTLLVFVLHHPHQDWEQRVQTWALALCFLSELLTRLYVVPIMLTTMDARSSLEEKAGVGQEVGCVQPGRLRHCPYYGRLHQRFRRFHGLCAIANILAMGCNAIHMYHLAARLSTVLT